MTAENEQLHRSLSEAVRRRWARRTKRNGWGLIWWSVISASTVGAKAGGQPGHTGWGTARTVQITAHIRGNPSTAGRAIWSPSVQRPRGRLPRTPSRGGCARKRE